MSESESKCVSFQIDQKVDLETRAALFARISEAALVFIGVGQVMKKNSASTWAWSLEGERLQRAAALAQGKFVCRRKVAAAAAAVAAVAAAAAAYLPILPLLQPAHLSICWRRAACVVCRRRVGLSCCSTPSAQLLQRCTSQPASLGSTCCWSGGGSLLAARQKRAISALLCCFHKAHLSVAAAAAASAAARRSVNGAKWILFCAFRCRSAG